MTPQEEEALIAERLARHAPKQAEISRNMMAAPKPAPVSQATSARRGAMSGLLMGFQPQIAGAATTGFGLMGDYGKSVEESRLANEAAWQANPVSYGTGYAGGTALGMIGPGLIGKGVQGARAAMGARSVAGAERALGTAERAILDTLPEMNALEASQLAARQARAALPAEAARAAAPIPPRPGPLREVLPTISEAASQTVPRAAAASANKPVEQKPNPFDKISSYLREQGMDENDPDERRRAAMALASSTMGRSAMNDESLS